MAKKTKLMIFSAKKLLIGVVMTLSTTLGLGSLFALTALTYSKDEKVYCKHKIYGTLMGRSKITRNDGKIVSASFNYVVIKGPQRKAISLNAQSEASIDKFEKENNKLILRHCFTPVFPWSK